MTDREWITVEQAAELLSVHDQTVRRWLRAGRLPGRLLSRRAGYRIRRADVERILEEGLPPDSAETKTSDPHEAGR